jgi:hypothetical protein
MFLRTFEGRRSPTHGDPKSLSPYKAIPNSAHFTRTQRFSINPEDKGRGELKNTRLENFSKGTN